MLLSRARGLSPEPETRNPKAQAEIPALIVNELVKKARPGASEG